MMISPGVFFFFIFIKILIFQAVARAKGQKITQNEEYPHKKISEILPLHSGIIVVLSNKY